MEEKRFQKKEEDFICEHCGANVVGDGYTNHCPKCLWAKHVDVNPGDRAEICKGMMEPVGVEVRGGEYTLLHRCQKCGFERKNKSAQVDDFDAIVALSRKPK